jgi:hypothetical protein
VSETQWYRGTADAVAQNIDIIDSYDVEYVLILAGDHIYKMDYERMIRHHVESGADVTVGCLTVPRMEATRLRRDGMWTPRTDHEFPRKARRSARYARRPDQSRWPRWASTSSTGISCATSLPRHGGPEFQPRFRHRPDPRHRQERQGDGASVLRQLRAQRRPRKRPIGAMSARSTRSGRPIST